MLNLPSNRTDATEGQCPTSNGRALSCGAVRNPSNLNGARTRLAENMRFRIEFEQEDDGRWIAEIPELPGVMVYGATREAAQSRVEALAVQVVAEGAA